MSKVEAPAVERIIANTINETARGDPHALAARIVAALAEAGFRIVSASGRDDTALGHQRAKERQLYRSPTGIPGSLRAIPRQARPSSGTSSKFSPRAVKVNGNRSLRAGKLVRVWGIRRLETCHEVLEHNAGRPLP